MGNLSDIVTRLLKIVFFALVVFYETPEGKEALDGLLAQIEAEGIDVPLWNPEDGFDLFGSLFGEDVQRESVEEVHATAFQPPVNPASDWAAKKAAGNRGGQ